MKPRSADGVDGRPRPLTHTTPAKAQPITRALHEGQEGEPTQYRPPVVGGDVRSFTVDPSRAVAIDWWGEIKNHYGSPAFCGYCGSFVSNTVELQMLHELPTCRCGRVVDKVSWAGKGIHDYEVRFTGVTQHVLDGAGSIQPEPTLPGLAALAQAMKAKAEPRKKEAKKDAPKLTGLLGDIGGTAQ